MTKLQLEKESKYKMNVSKKTKQGVCATHTKKKEGNRHSIEYQDKNKEKEEA
jgi:hypothetical protein